MAKSYNSYVGNGSTQVFSLSFPYLAQSHVKVYVGGVEDTTFTWLTSSSLTLSSVPVNGAVVLIKRVTPTTPLIDFVDGSVVTESLLDTATIQSMYIAEETQDTAATAIIYNAVTDVWEGNAKRLSNLADPTSAQDAVTKNWAETSMTANVAQALGQATIATTQATAAASSATSAATSASTANTKAIAASTSEANAASSASSAASSATTATTKATEASTSATNAASSATASANSATASANSAASALSAKTAAEAAQVAAETIFDAFDDRYLGSKSSDPTLDNDGNALVDGALYFNTTANVLKVYDLGTATWLTIPQVTIAALTDVTLTSVTAGEILVWSGTEWVNNTLSEAGIQPYDADTAKTDVAQTFTAAQRGSATTDNDLSFNLSVGNNFTCTPTGTGALTFTNHTAGQSGYVLLINTGGYAITAAATTKVGATFLSTISTAGTYLISYYDNGTNTYCTASGALS